MIQRRLIEPDRENLLWEEFWKKEDKAKGQNLRIIKESDFISLCELNKE